jgi:hypothetical protein
MPEGLNRASICPTPQGSQFREGICLPDMDPRLMLAGMTGQRPDHLSSQFNVFYFAIPVEAGIHFLVCSESVFPIYFSLHAKHMFCIINHDNFLVTISILRHTINL